MKKLFIVFLISILMTPSFASVVKKPTITVLYNRSELYSNVGSVSSKPVLYGITTVLEWPVEKGIEAIFEVGVNGLRGTSGIDSYTGSLNTFSIGMKIEAK